MEERAMKLEQYYLECLSQASYLIADETSGLAAVVDPRRDVQTYIDDAEAAGLRIAYVIETHFHADFLSGHLELAAATGATIVYGSAADTEFEAYKAADGERLSLGEVELEIRHTPGHTPESISVVVWEHADDAEPHAVLTGDTLFIGDVGRPDLLVSVGHSAGDLGGQLYDSLWTKVLDLPESTRVLPAHGAGSACGKNLSTETSSTIGEQLRTNYALQVRDRDRFVEIVTEGQSKAPDYFIYDAGLNRSAHELLDDAPPAPMDLDGVLAARDEGAILLDVRDATAFAAGHIAGSINVGLDGRYAEYVGTVVDPDDRIVLITDPGEATEAKVRLGRIGFDGVVGCLEGPEVALIEHPEVAARSSRLTAAELAERRGAVEGLQIVDVRGPGERITGSIDGALHLPLPALRSEVDQLDLDRPIVVHCAGGYRSSIAASWLRAAGAHDVSDLLGGFGAWAERLDADART
jgi:hydroxyacylglutathione hydrolase